MSETPKEIKEQNADPLGSSAATGYARAPKDSRERMVAAVNSGFDDLYPDDKGDISMESIKFCIEYLTNIVFNSGSIDDKCGMEKITVNAELLFVLESKQQWVNRVPQILPPKIRAGETWVWVDKNGDVFECGIDFMVAEEKATYPCKVYRLSNVAGAHKAQHPVKRTLKKRRNFVMEFKEAISKIKNELKNDASYRESWKANIAMAYKDCEYWYQRKTGKKYLNKKDRHVIANDAAEHFLKMFCD